MGTRADFYVGRGENAEWIGSIAWDGYPEGIHEDLFKSKTEKTYRKRVAEFFADRDDVTLPSRGWPWPWDDSRTTDYAYAFDAKAVWASSFGGKWFDPRAEEADDSEGGKVAVFPNMKTDKSAPAGSKRSGVMVIGF